MYSLKKLSDKIISKYKGCLKNSSNLFYRNNYNIELLYNYIINYNIDNSLNIKLISRIIDTHNIDFKHKSNTMIWKRKLDLPNHKLKGSTLKPLLHSKAII